MEHQVDGDNAEFLEIAESLGLYQRPKSGIGAAVLRFQNRKDLFDKVIQLGLKFQFQIRQKHSKDQICYQCKSYPDCPFTIRGRIQDKGCITLSNCIYYHNHPFGIEKMTEKTRNTMVSIEDLAQRVLDSEFDYINGTGSQMQLFFKEEYRMDVKSTRIYTVKKLLESGELGNDVEKFKKQNSFDLIPTDPDAERDEFNNYHFYPVPINDIEHEREELKRMDREHRRDMEYRLIKMEEITSARLNHEAQTQRRLLEIQVELAELQAKVSRAKACHEMIQTGMSRDEVDSLLG